MRIIDDLLDLIRLNSTPPRAARRQAPGEEQKLDIAVAPLHGRVGEPLRHEARLAGRREDLCDRLGVQRAVAHDATLPHIALRDFELGLDERDERPVFHEQARDVCA